VDVEDAQEALDMVIQAYRIAEDPSVLTPFMINIDGFILTHKILPPLRIILKSGGDTNILVMKR